MLWMCVKLRSRVHLQWMQQQQKNHCNGLNSLTTKVVLLWSFKVHSWNLLIHYLYKWIFQQRKFFDWLFQRSLQCNHMFYHVISSGNYCVIGFFLSLSCLVFYFSLAFSKSDQVFIASHIERERERERERQIKTPLLCDFCFIFSFSLTHFASFSFLITFAPTFRPFLFLLFFLCQVTWRIRK